MGHLSKQANKTFHFQDVDCCVDTSRTRGRTKKKSFFRQAKQLAYLFIPTKNPLIDLAMNGTSTTSSDDRPRTAVFDSDADKFLIDSGASHHLWKYRRAFTSYRPLTKEERMKEALLGVNGETVMPLGIGTVPIKLEDDLNIIHTIELRDVRHLPSAPLNIMVPQVFVWQRREEGDTKARCSIDDMSIELEWLSTKDQKVSNTYRSTRTTSVCALQPLVSVVSVHSWLLQCLPTRSLTQKMKMILSVRLLILRPMMKTKSPSRFIQSGRHHPRE